ncbi:hypothetical protein [Dictyobacter kobayashii]|uniref:Type II secretion system protein GspE N-terminal domain-containing protein n=1 Tax=Dictyobacter kobayashii TaxID=2014872 RepID=A0A402AKQ5_9CHLR|nr:hypothetical protein [Dictyobacter kobayashii]GCE19702.1 hypothetical protein KDK_35020 [Dictyobacter kobayashii]
MCKKALSLPAFEPTEHSITVISSIQEVAKTMQRLIAGGLPSLALIVLPLHFDSRSNPSANRETQIKQSMRYYVDHLRKLVRKSDHVLLHETTLYILLPRADINGATIVQERLWEALLWQVHNAPETEILRPTIMAIGYSAHPHPHSEIHACIMAAREMRSIFDVQPITSNPVPVEDEELSHQARQLGIPYLSLLPRKVPARILQVMPPHLAQELHCYPVGRERDTLTVAMTDPNDSHVLSRLQQATGLRIFPVIASPQELQTALEQFI